MCFIVLSLKVHTTSSNEMKTQSCCHRYLIHHKSVSRLNHQTKPGKWHITCLFPQALLLETVTLHTGVVPSTTSSSVLNFILVIEKNNKLIKVTTALLKPLESICLCTFSGYMYILCCFIFTLHFCCFINNNISPINWEQTVINTKKRH